MTPKRFEKQQNLWNDDFPVALLVRVFHTETITICIRASHCLRTVWKLEGWQY
jgi:hypothetical protein